MNLSAIILAAGEGRRIGIPKAIFKVNDRLLADLQYELLASLGFTKIVIVIGAESERVEKEIRHKEAVVVNADYRLGQFSSLVKGILSLSECDGILVLPVDTYPVDKGVIGELIEGFDLRFDAVIPIFKGRRGHPVIISFSFARSLLNYDVGSSRLDYILRNANIKLVEVSNNSILNNLNYISDLLHN